ncbi:FAD-dependent monooxygenase [Crossiella sp. CA-258035]|uniref:FAD-dependent monooxygenase n=1 Tax=Crossiella sp. CA-258035 TaxID=2981138 RepID=UPI0024BC4EF7|nr:FAD-dependent monooxygenase [Crossiella sp. CA-258035]WHT15672.1 FAD-dependent monooxygenase [Crossiella sp. CA-258035]
MTNRNVLISGASIAGPALAFWLRRYGFNPTVVERAPALREGGFAVDFRGPVHLEVLRRMGILDAVRAKQTDAGEMIVVDRDGRRLAGLPAYFTSGEVEILRGDLSRIIYDRTKDETEYVFGDSISSLTETPDGVEVTFERGAPRTFDLVIGADGLHSAVRRLTFGEESQFLRHLGYYVCGFSMPDHPGLDNHNRLYNEPGRGASLGGVESGTLLVFASDPLEYDRRDPQQQMKIVERTYAGMGWETSKIIDAMWTAPDFYFDSISQVHIDRLSSGRVALVGDAGYGATCGGLGTGLAIVAAHVLAGELHAADGDHRVAFRRYEEIIREYATGCQKTSENAGPFLSPRTAFGIRRRNLMYKALSSPRLSSFFNKLTTKAAAGLRLPSYPR